MGSSPASPALGTVAPRPAMAGAPASPRLRLSLAQRTGLVWLLFLSCLMLSAWLLSVWGSRMAWHEQQARHDADRARSLAAALAALQGDTSAVEQLLGVQWAGGSFRSLRFQPEGAAPAIELDSADGPGAAPAWFVALLGPAPAPQSAPVGTAVRPLGSIEVVGATTAGVALLWRDALHVGAALAALGLLAGLAGLLLLARLRAALRPALEQARVLAAGRCTKAEPQTDLPEMQLLTQAMNSMVERLKSAVDVQVAQVEQLRRQAHLDSATGLFNRRHFLAELDAALQRENGIAASGLVVLRLRDLAGVNRTLGHAAGDRALAAMAQALATYGECVPGSIAGRLNGADFALCLPVGGMALETAQTLATAMHAVLPSIGSGVAVSLGGVELRHGLAAADAMARADDALARAELRGPYGVEVAGPGRGEVVPGGQSAWRDAFDAALAAGRVALAQYPLVDAQGELIHLEAPLRMQLQSGASFEPAAAWLPLAVRTRRTGEVDARAVALALEAIVRDGRPRSVNLAPASLVEDGFASRLRGMLFAAPRAARRLALEIDEAAAVERFAPLRDLARLVRPCGVRFGLEHAGRHLASIDHLFEDWLDFVKLDASVGSGVAGDAHRAGFVRAAVGLLHGLAIDVHAEGVRDDEDAAVLWDCGVDGLTGPWATARFAHPR